MTLIKHQNKLLKERSKTGKDQRKQVISGQKWLLTTELLVLLLSLILLPFHLYVLGLLQQPLAMKQAWESRKTQQELLMVEPLGTFPARGLRGGWGGHCVTPICWWQNTPKTRLKPLVIPQIKSHSVPLHQASLVLLQVLSSALKHWEMSFVCVAPQIFTEQH